MKNKSVLINIIVSKLRNEGIEIYNYNFNKAEIILSDCVRGLALVDCLRYNENEILERLKFTSHEADIDIAEMSFNAHFEQEMMKFITKGI